MSSTTVPDEVDIIVVGGGPAGCVIAGRLAKADPTLHILLIEQGDNNRDNPIITTPAFFLTNLLPGSTTIDATIAKHSELVAGRSIVVPSGRVLGGGSSVNFMKYTRPSASDFDDWKMAGWTFQALLPLFKKFETYHVEEGKETHGYDGPIHVSYGGTQSHQSQDFSAAVKAVHGVDSVVDLQDFKAANKSTKWVKWINPETGKRSDAAHGYVHPILDTQTNIHLLVQSKVARVLFEGTTAVGVEYVKNQQLDDTADQTPKTVLARKLVVISSGALGTPQILERSGVGSASVLSPLGIPVVSDLPGVGTNYQDHTLILAAVSKVKGGPDETGDLIIRQDPSVMSRLNEEYKSGKGALAWNFIDAGSKLSPSSEELVTMGEDFDKVWQDMFVPFPDKSLMFIGILSAFPGDPSLIPAGQYMTMGNYLNYPLSRGTLHISSKDVYAAPDFRPEFLSHPADIAPHIWGYKKNREIMRRMESFDGEVAATHPPFRVDSKAVCTDKHDPDVKTIEYSKEDDKILEQWLREKIETCWHSLGTAPMKHKENGGVVDKNLNVYGTKNLKVADLSICPLMVGANTYSTALVVGEKAAVIITEELGIAGLV